MRTLLRVIVSVVWLPLAASPAPAEEHWPQFRGPNSRGVSDGHGLPDRWSATENVRWKRPIPGRGWSSPIVWGDRIFLTSAVQEGGDVESAKAGLYLFGERPAPKESQRWMVYCLDFPSGKILWERTAGQGAVKYGRHLKNSFASETPVTDGQRVYAYFGCLGLFCYDYQGREIWSRKFPERRMRMGWGPAASPAADDQRIYLVNDNEEHSWLTALDKHTGRTLWQVDRDETSNWSTPLVWTNSRRTEIVTTGSRRVRSYQTDGRLLWEMGGLSSIHIPTPFAAGDLLYVTSGYLFDRHRPLAAIRPGASGDISLQPAQDASDYVAWCQRMAGPYNPTPVVCDGAVYVLYDRGMLACYDAQSGAERYGKTRIDSKARAFTASPWAYEGKVFCLSEDGDTFVVRAGREFKLLATNSLGEMCLATPAIAGQSLLVRSESALYCIGGERGDGVTR
jgi:outer membrane protein assembly factor BamB